MQDGCDADYTRWNFDEYPPLDVMVVVGVVILRDSIAFNNVEIKYLRIYRSVSLHAPTRVRKIITFNVPTPSFGSRNVRTHTKKYR